MCSPKKFGHACGCKFEWDFQKQKKQALKNK